VLQLQADIQAAGVVAHGLVEGQAGAGALLAHDPRLAGQLFQACFTTLGQGMLRRAEHHQFIFDPGLHLDIRVLAVALDHAHVQFVMGYLLHHMDSVVHLQFDPAFRVALHKTADQQGGQVVAHRQGGADIQ
jgi:hypothetical protein